MKESEIEKIVEQAINDFESKFPSKKCSLEQYYTALTDLSCAVRERMAQVREELGQ